jgi:hypothetical protein
MNVENMDYEVRQAYFVEQIEARGYTKSIRDPDELGEYWLGVLRATKNVKNDIGDPVGYVHWKGKNAIADYRRKKLRESSTAYCYECGDYVAFEPENARYGGKLICRRCGHEICREKANGNSNWAELYLEHATNRLNVDNAQYLAKIQEVAQKLADIAQIKSERQIDILNVLSGKDLSPCEACQNSCKGLIPFGECRIYINSISKAWDISPGSISTYIRRMRKALLDSGVSP